MIAVDTNILVYAHRADSPEHLPAWLAMEKLSDEPYRWAIPWPCIHEFLAVVTGRAFGDKATPLADALQAIHTWLSHPKCLPINETDGHMANLAGLCERARLSGGAVHDARIAAICLDHGVRELWTCDRDFNRFPDLIVRNPLIPSLHEPPPPAYSSQAIDGAVQ